MPLTVGTSLAVIIPTAITSYLTHRRKGAVDDVALRLWALPCVVGVVAGSLLATIAPAALFKVVFPTVSAAIGTALLLGTKATRVAENLPGPLAMRIIGSVIGIPVGMNGHQAVATSAGLGVFRSDRVRARRLATNERVAAVVNRLRVTAWRHLVVDRWHVDDASRARLAHAIARQWLELAFAFYLLTMAARFIVALVW
jgi:uncharacterized protein